MNRTRMLRRAAIGTTVTVLAATALTTSAAASTVNTSATPSTVTASPTCALLAGGDCRLAYSSFPDGAIVTVPGSLSTVSVLVQGAGGGSTSTTGKGGAGALVLAELPVPAGGGRLVVQLGQQGQGSSGGAGWSTGGAGGSSSGEYEQGAGGGGSSPDAQNGQGGASGASGGSAGASGDDAVGTDETSGGGGGGGGYNAGGAGGGAGGIGQCNNHGNCPPRAAPGAGGGGGGGRSYVAADAQSVFRPVFATATAVDATSAGGAVTVFGAAPQSYTCGDVEGGTFTVPVNVSSHGLLMLGGSGTQGGNRDDTEGHGGAISGLLAVTPLSLVTYFTGCQGGFGGEGYGMGGAHGTAHYGFNNSGGIGGGASALLDQNQRVLVGAGGGGGDGGDFGCVSGDDCLYRGGYAGDGGGLNGTTVRFDGQGGGGPEGFGGGDGGCAACESGPDGSVGGHSKYGGGGGGGGGGVPIGGAGGWGATVGGGGGGGAGDSYTNAATLSFSTSGTQTRFGNGAIYLIPVTAQAATREKAVRPSAARSASGRYRVHVALAGDDAGSHRRTSFVVDQTCTLDGAPLAAKTVKQLSTFLYLKAGSLSTSPALPVGTVCTLRAIETGSATRVLPATKRIVIGTTTHDLTFAFGYDTAKLVVTNTSTGSSASFVDVVSCTYGDGRASQVRLPNGGGFAVPHGSATHVFRVPVGAQCRVDQRRTAADARKLASVGGVRWTTITKKGPNHLSVVDVLRKH